LQGRVGRRGATGRFDDVVGSGFVLLSPAGDPASLLAPDLATFFGSIGGIGAHVAPGGPVDDVNGSYARWFAEHRVAVVLQRPDFHVFGTAPSLAGAGALVAQLGRALGRGPSPRSCRSRGSWHRLMKAVASLRFASGLLRLARAVRVRGAGAGDRSAPARTLRRPRDSARCARYAARLEAGHAPLRGQPPGGQRRAPRRPVPPPPALVRALAEAPAVRSVHLPHRPGPHPRALSQPRILPRRRDEHRPGPREGRRRE